MIWAFGNLRGGKWEYSLKLGSFNLAIILLTNFYTVALTGNQELPLLWEIIIGGLAFPLICLVVTMSLYSYLKETVDREVTRGVLIGGSLGYMISMIIVSLLA